MKKRRFLSVVLSLLMVLSQVPSNGIGRVKAESMKENPIIEVEKTFTGLTQEQIDSLSNYEIIIKNESNSKALKLNDENVVKVIDDDNITYRWVIDSLKAGSYQVQEFNDNVINYGTTRNIDAQTITTKEKTWEIFNINKETSCAPKEWEVGKVDLIVAKLTKNAGYFVWTNRELDEAERLQVVDWITSAIGFNPKAVMEKCYFHYGDISNTLIFRDGEISYDGNNILTFDASKQWAMFATASYKVLSEQSAKVKLHGVYEKYNAKCELVLNKTIEIDKAMVDSLDLTKMSFEVKNQVETKNISFAEMNKTINYLDDAAKIELTYALNVDEGEYSIAEVNTDVEGFYCEITKNVMSENGNVSLIENNSESKNTVMLDVVVDDNMNIDPNMMYLAGKVSFVNSYVKIQEDPGQILSEEDDVAYITIKKEFGAENKYQPENVKININNMNGEIIQTVTLNKENNWTETVPLSLGEYSLEEVEATKDGYNLDVKYSSQTFELTQNEEAQTVTITNTYYESDPGSPTNDDGNDNENNEDNKDNENNEDNGGNEDDKDDVKDPVLLPELSIQKMQKVENGSTTPDIQVAKTGNTVIYSLIIANNGNASAANITVKDVVPLGLVVNEKTISYNGTLEDGIVHWNIDNLDAGQSITVSFSVLVSETAADLIENTATMKYDDTDYNSNTVKIEVEESEKTPGNNVKDDDKPIIDDSENTKPEPKIIKKEAVENKAVEKKTVEENGGPQTGDESVLAVWTISLLASMVTMIAIYKKREMK